MEFTEEKEDAETRVAGLSPLLHTHCGGVALGRGAGVAQAEEIVVGADSCYKITNKSTRLVRLSAIAFF
jgi:hypothetical protein